MVIGHFPSDRYSFSVNKRTNANDAEKKARSQWLEQRDLILQILSDFRSGIKVPTPNVDEIVEKCLAEDKKEEVEFVVVEKVTAEETDKLVVGNEAGNAETYKTSEENVSAQIELGKVEENEPANQKEP